jgi:hypothetical protein
MVEFNDPTQANMDIVLEEVCAELPHGGGYESRKFIAEQLIQYARSDNALGVAEQPWVNWVSAGARGKSSVPVTPGERWPSFCILLLETCGSEA